jgi:hypothetical protein
LDEDTL